MRARWRAALALAALLLAGCQGAPPASQKIEIMTSFKGTELESFRQVLDAFSQQSHIDYQLTPNVSRDVDEPLGNRLDNPPDVAILPQPGEVSLLVHQDDAVAPLAPDTQAAVRSYYDPLWQEAGTVSGRLYGVVFKGADKSVMWYRPPALQRAGVPPPTQGWDWNQFMSLAGRLAAADEPPVAVAGSDGWTLTDWFENILLSQSGPDAYDELGRHEIRWTDPPVVAALRTLARLWGDQWLLMGGTQGALHTSYDNAIAGFTSANQSPGFLYEGSFVETGLAARGAQAHVDYDLSTFPAPGPESNAVVIGGDTAVVMRHAQHPDAAQDLLRYLASPEAAMRWIQSPVGAGYFSPNREVPLSAYPTTGLTAFVARHIGSAHVVRFDMSDTMPPQFGSRDEWVDMQNFLAHPDNVGAAARDLESHATNDLGSGGRPAELPRCQGC